MQKIVQTDKDCFKFCEKKLILLLSNKRFQNSEQNSKCQIDGKSLFAHFTCVKI